MTWLVEDPTLILTAGLLIELLLGVALFQTGRGAILAAMVGVLLGVAGLLIVERVVVTDRERVAQVLDEAVEAAIAGDVQRVLDTLSPNATEARNRLERVLQRYEVRDVKLRQMRIVVERRVDPPLAEATFRAVVSGRDRAGRLPRETMVGRVTVELRLEDGQWCVVDFETAEGP